MFGSKRKARASPEIIEFDKDEQGSPLTDRGKQNDRDISQRGLRSNSEEDGYHNDNRRVNQDRIGALRPRSGGYRPQGSEFYSNEYEG
jgi:hypothetical protein